MVKFIYFGRVTYEKGIDHVIEAFSELHQNGIQNWFLDIYGDGPLLDFCKARAKKLPQNVHVHGWATQQTIHNALRGIHYCVMPSRVIESFGMSALESLAMGVTVIGSKVGGLEQFIQPEFDTSNKRLYSILHHTITTFSVEKQRKESKEAHELAQQYLREKWLSTIQHMGDIQRVYIVSDYIARIGGIESLLFNIKHILEDAGSQVYMHGWRLKKNKRTTLRRKLGLISTSYNWSNYIKLHMGISQYKPTLVWLHSVNRYLGWLPIKALHKTNDKQIRCSVHDLGMFHPFGADVTSLQDIPTFSLKGFTSITKNPLKKILIGLKFFSILLLQKQLIKKVDMRLVPSYFMVDIIHTKRDIPLRKITVLPHFIS